MRKRVQAVFGDVVVKGPNNASSNKWVLDMTHSQLALYWSDNPERARREMQSLREALNFIEAHSSRVPE